MKNIGEGYWTFNGCDIYLSEHPKLIGKYEIFKGCDVISRASNLTEAKRIIIEKFGKMSGGARVGAGRHKSPDRMVDCTIKLPPKVKANLTTKEKRTLLQIGEHEKSMTDLISWCEKMEQKLNSILKK